MSAMLITFEDFERMRGIMDSDGDGQVSKEEFKVAYKEVYNGPLKEFESAYEHVWAKIDADGDGNLTVDELAKFYGFDTETGEAGEMSDEQILQALGMAAELDAKMIASKKPEPEKAKKKEPRDNTYKVLQMEKKILMGDKKKPGTQEDLTDKNIADMVALMEILSSSIISELKSDNADKDTVFKALEVPGVIVRCEDANGQTPLHKLARFVIPADNPQLRNNFQQVFLKLIKMMKDECKALGKSLVNDINKQDSTGKTPIFVAIESKNILMIEQLNSLGHDKPNSLIVTSQGWSVLHQAVQADNFEVVKEVVRGLQADGGRLKVLINLKDKSDRQPLHIAAYRCEDHAIIQFLMDNGANGESKDSGGNSASKLADKASRRKSKEIIDEGVRRISKEGPATGGRRHSKEITDVLLAEELKEKKRRASRDSKELMIPPAAPAAAPAAAGGMAAPPGA